MRIRNEKGEIGGFRIKILRNFIGYLFVVGEVYVVVYGGSGFVLGVFL